MSNIARVLVGSILLLQTSSAWASGFAPEADLCAGVTCTAKMKEINKAFHENLHFVVSQSKTQVYSGSCYHIATSLDANREEFGMALFEPLKNEVLGYSGIFSYYAGVNPYKEMNAEEASAYLANRGSEPHAVALEPGKGHVTVKFGELGRNDYWFHTDEAGNNVYMLSHWNLITGQQRSFCHFTAHSAM